MKANDVVKEINEICQGLSLKLNTNSDNILVLSEVLVEVNSVVFRTIRGIRYYDEFLAVKRKDELLGLLKNDDKKKLLNSSTLAKTYMDGVLSEYAIPMKTLEHNLKALYAMQNSIITLISKSKFLSSIERT